MSSANHASKAKSDHKVIHPVKVDLKGEWAEDAFDNPAFDAAIESSVDKLKILAARARAERKAGKTRKFPV